MAFALQREPVEGASEILAALAEARSRPAATLRRAAERAHEIVPAVVEVVETAARGVFLMPQQYNLLFWGMHAVAAARRTELYRPLLNMLRQVPRPELDNVLGAALWKTLKKIIVSVFDGDAEPLIAACADRNLDGDVRWHLQLALARLTFDGRIPREATLGFLDRFEREPLADPGDAAWEGWQDAITLLGLGEMRERLRATWSDGRNRQEADELDDFERLIGIAQALAPGDDSLFEEEDIVPLRDPVDDLEWMTLEHYARYDPEPDPNDPAGGFALKQFEIDWLEQFLESSKMPPRTANLEEVDGFFSALIAGPPGARIDDCLTLLWHADRPEHPAPCWDSPEQQQYVEALLRRHWTSISLRLERTYPHVPILESRLDPWRGHRWARACIAGMAMRETEWALRISEETVDAFATVVVTLDMDRAKAREKGITPSMRAQLIKILPQRLVAVHHAWRGREDPFPPAAQVEHRKVGRNEPCPCGSGKKYKRCCGSPGTAR
jgi:yecA family protein